MECATAYLVAAFVSVTAVPQACGTWVTDMRVPPGRHWCRQSPNEEKHMKANMGGTDRILRVLGGIALLALVFVLEGPARWLGLIGLVPLATAAFGFCPAYALFGLSTCPLESKRA
jgi:hypothetical protein